MRGVVHADAQLRMPFDVVEVEFVLARMRGGLLVAALRGGRLQGLEVVCFDGGESGFLRFVKYDL